MLTFAVFPRPSAEGLPKGIGQVMYGIIAVDRVRYDLDIPSGRQIGAHSREHTDQEIVVPRQQRLVPGAIRNISKHRAACRARRIDHIA